MWCTNMQPICVYWYSNGNLQMSCRDAMHHVLDTNFSRDATMDHHECMPEFCISGLKHIAIQCTYA